MSKGTGHQDIVVEIEKATEALAYLFLKKGNR
jgi:hypothetical protein